MAIQVHGITSTDVGYELCVHRGCGPGAVLTGP
jgi:hypothetical protein